MNTLHNCSHFQQRSGLIRNPSRVYKRLLGSPPLTEPDSIPKSGLQWKQLNLVTNPGCRKKGSIIGVQVQELKNIRIFYDVSRLHDFLFAVSFLFYKWSAFLTTHQYALKIKTVYLPLQLTCAPVTFHAFLQVKLPGLFSINTYKYSVMCPG